MDGEAIQTDNKEVNPIAEITEQIGHSESQTELQNLFIKIDTLIPKALINEVDVNKAKDCKQLYNLLKTKSIKLAVEVSRGKIIDPLKSYGPKYDQSGYTQETSQNQMDAISQLIDGGLKNTDNPVIQEMAAATAERS